MTADSETGAAAPKRACLHGWTKRQKCVLYFTIVLAVVTVAHIAVFIYVMVTRDTSEKTCLTKKCTMTAASLISAMDPSANPCEDFNKFTCADFIRKNPIPDGKVRTTTFLQYEDTFKLQIKDLIENHNSIGDPSVVSQAQEAYHVCINTTYHKKEELDSFKKYLQDTFGGWPVVEVKNWKQKSIEELLGQSEKLFGLSFLDIDIKNYPDDTSSYEVAIQALTSEARILNETDDEDNDEIREDEKLRFKAFDKFASLLDEGSDKKSAVGRTIDFRKMEDLKMKLVKPLDKNTTDSTVVMSVKELNSTQNKVNWFKILNILFESIHIFEGKETVVLKDPDKLNHVFDILKESPLSTVTNLIIWEVVLKQLMSNAGPEAEEIYEEYVNEVNKDRPFYLLSPKQHRWEKCLAWLEHIYPMVAARLFINKYVDKENKAAAEELVQLIQQSYKEEIEESKWLDEETKKRAILKVDSIRRFVGYPDFIFDDKELENEYKDVPIVKPTHFQNFLENQMIRYEKYREKYKIPDKESGDRWQSSPMEINAFYDPETNSIWFPAGILQLPFFDWKRLAAINFGMIGAIIGHEIGHAFDNYGSRYDEKGNLINWWTNQTREIFDQKAECFIKQYSKYCPEDRQAEEYKCVNGTRTVGENLADSTGLKAAYEAYQLWTGKHGKEKRLPGLEEYSPEQLFFISYSYLWCENMPSDKWTIYEMDSHSPMKYRAIGVLSNYEEFRKNFNCTAKGTMNRDSDSCVVW
uniref:Neprilysin n=1 Tax=Hemiscolopendra marginata TaxID=943146 RepID=A0A646QJ69_9MYRI